MTNIVYKKIDVKSNDSLNNLFVRINDNGVQKYVAVKDLAILDDNTILTINTLGELNKAAKANCLYTKKSNGAKDKQVVLSDSDIYEAVEVKGASAESEEGYFTSTRIQGHIPVPMGYKRIVRIKRNNNKKEIVNRKQPTDALVENEYLLVKYANGTEDYLNRDEIIISSSKKALGPKKLNTLVKDNKIKELEDFNQNKIVKIDLKNAYVFENYTEKNEETGEEVLFREEVVGHTYKTVSISNGQILIDTQSVDPIYTERRYIKEDDKPIIRMTNYEVSRSESGDYVKVTFAGENNDTLISKDELYLDSGLTQKVSTMSENMIGKVLYAKSDIANTYFKVTEPISAVQANYTYNKKKYLQETEKKEDICADGAYLKLENGNYIKEKESVRPICYEYTKKDEKPEAYLAKVTDSEKGNITIIIPASAVKENNKSDNFRYGKYNISLDDIFGLKRSTKNMKDCDVLQTSTDQEKFQSCEVIRTPGEFHAQTYERQKQPISNIEEVLSKVEAEILRDYKEGKYTIEHVVDEKGKFAVIIRGKRFVFNEHIDMPDYSDGYSEYAYTKPNGKYNLKKGMAEGFKSWAKNAGIASLFVYGLGWPFLAVSTTFAAVAVGTLAASALLVPMIQGGKAIVHNRKNRLPIDKTKCQNKGTLKEILKELKNQHQKAVSKGKNFSKEDESRFNERMENLEKQAFFLAGGMTMADFNVKNGKMSPVGSSNYEEFKKYETEMYKQEADLKKLLKDMKKGKITREEYNAKYNEHQELLYNYVAKGIFVPTDKKYKAVIDAIRTTKGFVIAKYGQKENPTDKEKNIKEKLNDKKLNISRNFKCSISKIKGDELKSLTENLITIANNNPVDYDKIIIKSSYEAVETQQVGAEQVIDQQDAVQQLEIEQVATQQVETEQVVEQQAEVKQEAIAEKDKNVSKIKKVEENPQKKSSSRTNIAALGFDIVVYKKSAKGHEDTSESKMKTYIKVENLNKSSLDRVRKAIEYYDSGAKITKRQKAALTQYINVNLAQFEQESNIRYFEKVEDLIKLYNMVKTKDINTGVNV